MLSRKAWVFISLLCITVLAVVSTSSWILSVSRDSLPTQNASLCACHKCLMEWDPQFSELMKAAPQPFLTKENNISADDFKWWKHIQYEKRNFSFYNSTVAKVFQMFPASPDVTESSPERCTICAVVGNSVNLNGSHYGPLIDFHDIVIRMNRGPTKGYEKDVGNKTTHRVMYPNSAFNLDNSTHFVLIPFKIRDLEWLIKSFTPSRQETSADTELKANTDLVMILSPAFMKYIHYVWLKRKGMYPSTGFMALILSMHMCDEVNVFGFGADKNGNWNHYYETFKNKRLRTGQHPGKNEYNIIKQLHQQQKIGFFKGW